MTGLKQKLAIMLQDEYWPQVPPRTDPLSREKIIESCLIMLEALEDIGLIDEPLDLERITEYGPKKIITSDTELARQTIATVTERMR